MNKNEKSKGDEYVVGPSLRQRVEDSEVHSNKSP